LKICSYCLSPKKVENLILKVIKSSRLSKIESLAININEKTAGARQMIKLPFKAYLLC